nr:putative capsid [Marmot picobirnavirus]
MARNKMNNVKTNNNKRNRNRGGKTSSERRGSKSANFQDEFADREFQKGEKFEAKKLRNFGKDNDATWYAKNSQMLSAYANFSYNTALGTPFRLDDILDRGEPVQSNVFSTVPGILTLQLFPTPGLAVDATSPINIASQNAYSFVRYKNSGGHNYDNPDLMLYYLAMDSLYSAWNWMKRLYGLASNYDVFNRYYAKALVNANYVDFEDLMANLANFRGYINKTAAQITAFCVPATMSYMLRHSWAYSNVYKDSDVYKAQLYMYVPGIFYRYDETSSPQGGVLTPVPCCQGRSLQNLMKLQDIMNMIESMLNALLYSEDIGIMSGDVMKAYGDGSLFKLSPLEDNYTVTPVFSPEVLSQFENASIHRVVFGSGEQETALSQFNIRQDPNTNFIKYDPEMFVDNDVPKTGCIINMHTSQPTPEDTIVATRLVAPISRGNVGGYHFISVGSDFCAKGSIFSFTGGGNNVVREEAQTVNLELMEVELAQSLQYVTGTTVTDNERQLSAYKMAALSVFDWAPMAFIFVSSPGSTPADYVVGILGDLASYAIIPYSGVASMDSTALLSMFDVPNGSNF